MAGEVVAATIGDRLRFAHAIMHLLHHRFGHFYKETKETAKKRLIEFCALEVKGKQFDQPTLMPT